ncbi:MAG TPA: D-alanyl-D-alanine carboxypeptidase [Clostridiaceae bacterium]|nr:D-alanyl-D-alanine carboxypeptidase [Clostridiaceae bacterium]
MLLALTAYVEVYADEEEYEPIPFEIFEVDAFKIEDFEVFEADVFESEDVLPSSSPSTEPSAEKEATSPTSQVEVPVINAAAAIVMDMESGRILYEKNAYRRMPIASTTKIMTAILAIELGNLEDIVTVSKRASSIGGSVINLRTGEEIKLKDLLYGLMLRSGNDAAIAIAEHIGGSVENFVEMMNYKAKLLGARNTNFVTPHGLDREGHYSTAYDLAVITRYALQNPVFSQIVGTKNIIAGSRNLYNTNEMLDLYPGADGVKTGYTGQAGRCLVTSATRNGQRYISVVLNCPTRALRAQSSKKILDYAFSNYKPYTLLNAGEKIARVSIIKGIEDMVSVEAVNDIFIPLSKDEYERIQKKVIIPEYLEAPVYAGITVGEVQFFLDGKLLAHSELKTSADVYVKDYKYYIKIIIEEWMNMVR